MRELEEIADSEIKNASREELRQLIERQGYRCALTGIDLEPETAELDHVVPVSDGGNHSITNLQVLHKAVNRMKGAMSNDEFVRWCKMVAGSNDAPRRS
jgi:5-methylcytosine-specific restriction endonuclease McrA